MDNYDDDDSGVHGGNGDNDDDGDDVAYDDMLMIIIIKTMMMWCTSFIPTALLSSPHPLDRHILVGSGHDIDRGGGASAIMNQLIAALTEQTRHGWVPDRTAVFCSWGGTALGNIGSYEWGKVSRATGTIKSESFEVKVSSP